MATPVPLALPGLTAAHFMCLFFYLRLQGQLPFAYGLISKNLTRGGNGFPWRSAQPLVTCTDCISNVLFVKRLF